MSKAISNRIMFHDDIEVMEVDFSGYNFNNLHAVNQFYDALEESIAKTGEDKWFFLVNYSRTRIDSSAWGAFSRRGKELNLTHSQGSVRFDVSEDTARKIERDANTEAFDANLFTNRDEALKRIAEFTSQRRVKVVHEQNLTAEDMNGRLTFDASTQVMDVDFSHLNFQHSDDVHLVYDFIEEQIAKSGQKWFFLVNYKECQICPEAWIPFSQRGKSLNIAHSLGSVRYAPDSETEEEIRMRAESQAFRPNIRNTREEALVRIDEMRLEIAST